jgi:hypothetical protein
MSPPLPSRRSFLKTSVSATAALTAAPYIQASGKSGSAPVIIGEGEHRYECLHNWGQLPDKIQWGATHDVAVDQAGFIYIKHRSVPAEPMDSIVVFDPDGKYVRSFGEEYSRGGHGLDIRKEGNEEFLYLCSTKQQLVTKTTLQGEIVWATGTPWDSGVYHEKNKFIPTNVAFHPDGGFYVADGYGAGYIHRYDKDGRRLHTFGGIGSEHGQFRTPHGLWLDTRPGKDPTLCICDRANARLEYYSLDGKYLSTITGVSFPGNLDARGVLLLCADLHARVTLFDKDNKIITHLGHDPEWTKSVLAGNNKMRSQPERWESGKFIHPHDACFDHEGNIYVVEWVATGRVTKLRHLKA